VHPGIRDTQAARLDPWGSLAFSASLLCLIWGLIEANRIGWDNPLTYTRLVRRTVAGRVCVVERAAAADDRPATVAAPRFIGALLGMFAYAAAPR
jgi:hypothetical protein